MTDLTIVVPFFDERAYLRTAINSIRSQSAGDVQVVVVNDNPETFSQAEVRSFLGDDDADLIQHPQNLGLSAARNSGMDIAQGRFVGFLDADDYYTLGGLARHLRHATETGADITHAQTFFTRAGNADPRLLPRDAALFQDRRTCRRLTGAEEAQFITSSWSSLYRRAFLDDNALRFDPAQSRFEDRLFVLHTVTRADRLAFLGEPVRVWRGRAGSISVTGSTPQARLLQVQLLEKCMAYMRQEVGENRLPPRFAKRELFNTVSRLIWDMDVVDAIVADDNPTHADLARRIPALLGDDSFGQAIFDDPVLSRISRVGSRTRKGWVSRADFFAVHKALRDGDFAAARDRIAAGRDKPKVRRDRRAPNLAVRRVVLHLGLHKTGSTYLQHHLWRHRNALKAVGTLVPSAGFQPPDPALREGATPGHQGLVAALRRDDPAPWQALAAEVEKSRAHTLVLSCENVLFPTAEERDTLFDALADRLGGAGRVDLVALARRPDAYVEAFYRERVSGGIRSGPGGIAGFLVDYLPTLVDVPALFQPLESRFGTRVHLGDFDVLRGPGLWQGFCALAGLPMGLPALQVPTYPTPDRETILLLEGLNALVADPDRRGAILKAWFAWHPEPRDAASLLPPAERRRILDTWETASSAFAASRGYAPDLDCLRAALATEDWHPADRLSARELADLIDAAAQHAPFVSSAQDSTPMPDRKQKAMSLTISLRPWAADLVRRLRRPAG